MRSAAEQGKEIPLCWARNKQLGLWQEAARCAHYINQRWLGYQLDDDKTRVDRLKDLERREESGALICCRKKASMLRREMANSRNTLGRHQTMQCPM